jgi:lysophospholipase L1-like esterase
MRSRKWLVVLVSSVLSLATAEILLRNVAPRRTIEVLAGAYPAMFEDSDYLPYRLRRGYSGRLATREFDTSVRINSRGYRGEEFAAEKGDVFRILAIGDSYTFGWGVEDNQTYAALLRERLSSRHPSRRIEVINAGFAACYSPDTYYLYLKREGLALEPDLIVVGVYVGNDLDSPAAFENEWLEQDAEGLPLRIRNRHSHVVGNMLLPRDVPLRYRVPLLRRLHLFQGLADLWWALKPALQSSLRASATLHAASSGSDERVPYIYRMTYDDRTNTVMRRVESLFSGMQRLADEARVPLVFMIIPERVQLTGNALNRLPADIGKPQRLLGEFFEREGLRSVDLLPWLTPAAADQSLYFPLDGHWNAAGHEIGAQRLADALSRYLTESSPVSRHTSP